MPVAGNGQDDLRRTYLYRPIPAGMPATGEQLCRGVQATFWTEHVADSTLLEYLALPRLMAIAETAWSPEERKDFADFAAAWPRTPSCSAWAGTATAHTT